MKELTADEEKSSSDEKQQLIGESRKIEQSQNGQGRGDQVENERNDFQGLRTSNETSMTAKNFFSSPRLERISSHLVSPRERCSWSQWIEIDCLTIDYKVLLHWCHTLAKDQNELEHRRKRSTTFHRRRPN